MLNIMLPNKFLFDNILTLTTDNEFDLETTRS